MRLLVVDTSLSLCGCAFFDSTDRRIVARQLAMLQGSAESLMPMIDEVMTEAGVRFMDMDAFAVTIGPGNFTGLRVGLSACRGFALVTGRPLFGIGSLHVLAKGVLVRSLLPSGPFALLLCISETAFYGQKFDATALPLDEPRAISPAEFAVWREEAVSCPLGIFDVSGKGASFLCSHLSSKSASEGVSWFERSEGIDLSVFADLALTFPVPSSRVRLLYLRSPGARMPGEKPSLSAGRSVS